MNPETDFHPIEPVALPWPRRRDLDLGSVRKLLPRAVRARGAARRAVLRDILFRLSRPFTSNLAVEFDGVRFVLETADREVSRIVFIFGLYDLPTMHAAFHALSQLGGPEDMGGGKLLDIGANIGTTTLTAMSHFDASGSLAFEPDPGNYRSLRVNVAANGFDERVRSFQVALSDRSGTAELERSDWNYGDHRVRTSSGESLDAFGERGRHVVTVPARTLDEMLQGEGALDDVALAWMDVQGHEGHVLAGATRLLDAAKPVVTEYWPYGLRAAGGLDDFRQVVHTRFDRIVNLDAGISTGRFEPVPPTELDRIGGRLRGSDDHVDLLLVPPGLG